MNRILTTLIALAVATPAAAHLPEGEYGSFLAGVTHPLFGLDHVLAMIAVGLWAAQIGGRALWTVPSAFVGAMIAGFLAALSGLPLPFVEPMILASIMALGLLVALALRPAPGLAMGAVALFALFHGHAHGAELGQAQALQFGAGFAIATALLHAAGLAIAYTAARETRAARAWPLLLQGRLSPSGRQVRCGCPCWSESAIGDFRDEPRSARPPGGRSNLCGPHFMPAKLFRGFNGLIR